MNPNDDPLLEEELEQAAKPQQEDDSNVKKDITALSGKAAKILNSPTIQNDDAVGLSVIGQEAHEQEYLELQEENFEEYGKWHKHLEEVIYAMRLKRDALADVVKAMGEKKAAQSTAARDVKILIIVLGGAMQGPYGAGQMCALQEMGYTSKNINELDGFLGISAGASTCAFGMAGKKQALLGTSYFYTICASKAFFNYMRIHQVIDVSVIEEALRKEPTKLDVEAVRKNPARFYVQAYNATKGEPEFINAKDPHVDMVDAIHGSMAIPLVYNKAISINGCRYTDGAFDDPLPILRAIREFKPTHILILPNMPFNQVPLGAPSEIKNLLIKAIPHSGSFGFLRKVLSNRQALRQSLEKIAEQNHIKIGVAWPPDMGLGSFTQNVEQIKAAIKASAKDIFYLFGEPKNNLKLYEEEYGNQT